MILVGQYDSPFVRRVGIALHLYGLPYEHRPWSTFADADQVAGFNPLRRVPTLVLDDGEVLVDSFAILDHLDETVGETQALLPRAGALRRRALQRCALAMGMADKAVALFYERALHREPAPAWVDRCTRQIGDSLAALEASRAAGGLTGWFGDRFGHADIALAVALRFVREVHPALFDPQRYAALAAHATACEALDAFQAIQQRFIPPA